MLFGRLCHNEAVQLQPRCLGGITGDQGAAIKAEHVALDSWRRGSRLFVGPTADKRRVLLGAHVRALGKCCPCAGCGRPGWRNGAERPNEWLTFHLTGVYWGRRFTSARTGSFNSTERSKHKEKYTRWPHRWQLGRKKGDSDNLRKYLEWQCKETKTLWQYLNTCWHKSVQQ